MWGYDDYPICKGTGKIQQVVSGCHYERWLHCPRCLAKQYEEKLKEKAKA